MRRDVKIRPEESYKQALTRTIEELGQPTRQKIIDLLLIEGLKVGDICDRLELDTIIVAGVICDNIKSTSYISIEAK